MVKTIINRVYADFLLPSRLHELGKIVSAALEAGYRHETMSAYYTQLISGQIKPGEKLFLHRTDVDTDPATARKMFEVFHAHDVRTSFYFRKKTVDFSFMRLLNEKGYEVGYHYEEIADFCKRAGKIDEQQVIGALPKIRDEFLHNLLVMERTAGFKFTSVASHGDFVNRKLGIPNHKLMDEALLSAAGIQLEAYNQNLISSIDAYTSDAAYPAFYRNNATPEAAINSGASCILFLSHPRHWSAAPWINLKDNINRLREELAIR